MALLASTVIHSSNSKQVEAKTTLEESRYQLSLLELNSPSKNLKQLSDNQKNLVTQVSNLQPEQTNQLLADDVDLAPNNLDQETAKNRLPKLLPLFFSLLFFVPLGIFYPLFLFYKMLLTKFGKLEAANNPEFIKSDRYQEVVPSFNTPNFRPKTKSDRHQATVSKLQIAFTPPASQLRQELSRVTSIAEKNTESDVINAVNLIWETVQVLIEQENWTHISYNSQTLPQEDVRPEFDLISYQERNKFTSKTASLIKYNRNVSIEDSYKRDYSYVVVTLILCTSHSKPLFQTIKTKEQLVKELIKLGKIDKNSVMRFELLWNPQQEDIYISNDQLLIEYGNMTRLL